MVLFLTQCDVVLNEFLPVRRYAIVGCVAKLKISYGPVCVCLTHTPVLCQSGFTYDHSAAKIMAKFERDHPILECEMQVG